MIPLNNRTTWAGANLGGAETNNLMIADDLRVNLPSDVFGKLRADATLKAYSDLQLWDAIAFAWKQSRFHQCIQDAESQ